MMEKSTVGTGEAGLRDMECGTEPESGSKCGRGSMVRKGEPRAEESKREKRGSAGCKGGVMGDVGRIKG
jgi:hypothetical protein